LIEQVDVLLKDVGIFELVLVIYVKSVGVFFEEFELHLLEVGIGYLIDDVLEDFGVVFG